ncbi:6-phospho-beta-glucosidase [Mesoplasma florum L1]|uniref:6-phospho-beta-glucosidase n=1 Tax=Mesoplasma florum (strain ATCC 33453 / NBRC 100688 / NCTC 11704 / L1) TaxID=265311 RepID=Q6F0J9_MESFL|nr:glycoside hydrolase family 1 protein [Mesoplasma florum]AAT75974.1 6-phospho-beta-glucosidase [Mesoplasma florum L1]
MNKFPKDFLWGAATSAYQVEGGIYQGGKVPSSMDPSSKKHANKEITDFSVAADHYNHWKEDVALMAEMGFKSYRFSISWPRIIKDKEGNINQEGIDFYNNLLDELIKNNIEPVVTIFHFDIPMFVEDDGGLESKNVYKHYERYCSVLFKNFGSKVKYWLTVNELNVMVLVSQIINTNKEKSSSNEWQVMHNMNVVQAKAILMCREMCPGVKIGPAPNISVNYPASCKPEDFTAKLNMDLLRNWVYLDILCRGSYSKKFLKYLEENNKQIKTTEEEMELFKVAKPDFIAINYYSSGTVEAINSSNGDDGATNNDQQSGFAFKGFAKSVKNPNLQKTQFGWEIDPVGFRNTLREVWERYQLPIMVTENGIGAKDVLTEDGKVHDDYRIDYYKKHIHQMGLAIEDGVEMIGYMPWSAIDLVSTHEGISKRYGFIYVNRDEFDLKDMKRIRKDSFYWYKELIKNNGDYNE